MRLRQSHARAFIVVYHTVGVTPALYIYLLVLQRRVSPTYGSNCQNFDFCDVGVCQNGALYCQLVNDQSAYLDVTGRAVVLARWRLPRRHGAAQHLGALRTRNGRRRTGRQLVQVLLLILLLLVTPPLLLCYCCCYCYSATITPVILHLFSGLFSRTSWVSWYQNDKTSLDLNEARDDGVSECSGISWTTCKQSAPRCRRITTPTPHHSIFTVHMLDLTPSQRCQSPEGQVLHCDK